jgi:arylsulfatase A-like enzyme
VDRSIAFLEQAATDEAPFALFHCTQLPHMNHRHAWPAKEETLQRYDADRMPLAPTWQDDLSGKPPYLKTVRNRTQALKYGYDKPENIRRHVRDYYAVITDMDAALGRLLHALDRLGLRETTYILFMSDNGWMLGDHGFTSKVLHYEASMRVPLIVCGPAFGPDTDDHLVLNIDLAPTMLDLAGIAVPQRMHGRSLVPLLTGQEPDTWRDSFIYEALGSYGGTRPMLVVRTPQWKYAQTYAKDEDTRLEFEELYDLIRDPDEMANLAGTGEARDVQERLREDIRRHREEILKQ